MIKIDENGTVIPENEYDATKITNYEAEHNWQNYYDDGTRTSEQIKKNIYNGKYAECIVLIRILEKYPYMKVISGIRYGQKSHDNGSDITLLNTKTNKQTTIQVKNANDKWLNFSARSFAALNKFDGLILAYQASTGKIFKVTKSDLSSAYTSNKVKGGRYLSVNNLKRLI